MSGGRASTSRAHRRANGWRGDVSLFVHAPRPWHTWNRSDVSKAGNHKRRRKAIERTERELARIYGDPNVMHEINVLEPAN